MIALRGYGWAGPSPEWMDRSKARLLNAYDQVHRKLNSPRFWAMYVSPTDDPIEFADAVRARGPNWRPIVVRPERLAVAAGAIQPALVVIDAELPNHDELAQLVLTHSAATVVADIPPKLV